MQNKARDAGHADIVGRIVQALVSPGARGITGLANWTGDIGSGMTSGHSLRNELRTLRAEQAATRMYLEQMAVAQREIDDLRKISGLPAYGKTKLIADIIEIFPRENRFTIGVGSNQGVKVGAPVVTAAGILGVVQVVGATSSQAQLLNSLGVKIGAIALRNPPVAGLLVGKSATTLSLEFTDPQAPVQNGDIVVTSGFSDKIPRGIPIGKIIQIDDDPAFGMRRAQVYPNVSLGAVREVVVLL